MTFTRLTAVALVLTVGWGLYWAGAAYLSRTALTTWMEARRADGWQADWARISIAGFPNRLDRTIHRPALADPESGWAWDADWLQLLGLVYRGNHVIVVLPPEQRLATPNQRMTLTGDRMRASLVLEPGPADSAPLKTLTAVLRELALTSEQGWSLAADETRLALRPTAGRALSYDLGVEVVGLRPPAPTLVALSRRGLLPETVDRLRIDAAVTLSGPLNQTALETERPAIRAIELREARAIWGGLDLAIAGDLETDARGRAVGELVVKARNWQDMLDIARSLNAVPQTMLDGAEQALTLLAGLAGRRDTLDLPLSFRDGRTFLGPLPIATAPILRLP